jgi:2-phospho-L-lactate guanylyltransferase (CobY/MobA/RfbA family)
MSALLSAIHARTNAIDALDGLAEEIRAMSHRLQMGEDARLVAADLPALRLAYIGNAVSAVKEAATTQEAAERAMNAPGWPRTTSTHCAAVHDALSRNG